MVRVYRCPRTVMTLERVCISLLNNGFQCRILFVRYTAARLDRIRRRFDLIIYRPCRRRPAIHVTVNCGTVQPIGCPISLFTAKFTTGRTSWSQTDPIRLFRNVSEMQFHLGYEIHAIDGYFNSVIGRSDRWLSTTEVRHLRGGIYL